MKQLTHNKQPPLFQYTSVQNDGKRLTLIVKDVIYLDHAFNNKRISLFQKNS